MTRQEIFDTVARHLLTQGKRSQLSDDSELSLQSFCAYRGEGGLKCAAGVLIADEIYTPALERKTVFDEIVSDALMRSGVAEEDLPLVSRLQQVHDSHLVAMWPNALRVLAEEFYLNAQVVGG